MVAGTEFRSSSISATERGGMDFALQPRSPEGAVDGHATVVINRPHGPVGRGGRVGCARQLAKAGQEGAVEATNNSDRGVVLGGWAHRRGVSEVGTTGGKRKGVEGECDWEAALIEVLEQREGVRVLIRVVGTAMRL